MLRTGAMLMLALTFASGAQAQETEAPAAPPVFTGTVLKLPQVPAQPAAPPAAPQEDDDERGGWNAVKRGFYSGLVAGGIVGIFLVTECGHPECGPLLTLAAGAGAGIGAAIDALVDHRPRAPGETTVRDASFARGKRIAVSFRKSW